MSKNNKHHNEQASVNEEAKNEEVKDVNLENPENVIEDVEIDGEDDEAEPLKDELNATMEELQKTKDALEKEKKEYLFLMAEFDNYRKRVTREKADLVKNAAEKVMKGMLPIVDDFERALSATKDSDDAKAIREGVELIYNKLVKYMQDNGVTAMESTGKEFDSELHEAIATIPAPAEDLKGKVIDTTTKGYTINDKVLRHAKVVVGE